MLSLKHLNGLVFLCGMNNLHAATEMFTLSPSDQASHNQEQIVTVLFRPVSVYASEFWCKDGLK